MPYRDAASCVVCLALCVLLLGVRASALAAGGESLFVVDRRLDIAPVWAGHPVGFCLLTHGDRQFVAFYDDKRQMTVGVRRLDSDQWQFEKLAEHVKWDSHNYITMTIDDDGFIHLCGNMHCVPIIYFRTTRPLDIATFQRVTSMVGSNEKRCTYPHFTRGARGELLFTYRDGHSGNGNQIWNVYDMKTKTWSRLLDKPLTDGRGKMNAYFHGPRRGPDGYFHLCWVWRDHGGCETNHDLSYARSKDLIHWETWAGKTITLPITLQSEGIVVDPVPAKGGMINGNTRIGFDSKKRVILSYHKFDENGKTQIYNARLEDGRWRFYQTSDWDYRWYFSGGGSIHFEIRLGSVSPAPGGGLRQSYSHDKYGSGTWRLDEDTLKPIGKIEQQRSRPAELDKAKSETRGMQVKWCGDAGRSGERGISYMLRWETLPVNRDHPHKEAPPPTMLQLYRFRPRGAAKEGAKVNEEKATAGKPVIRKLGTIDCDMVETTPIVFHGRLYRFEYVRPNYKPNKSGDSYFRFIDVETGEATPSFAAGYHLGSAHVEGDTVYVYGVDIWGGSLLKVFWSKDLKTWSEQTAIELRGWGLYNNSVCRGPDRYVMSLELGEPPEEVGARFTIRFLESQDLLNWKLTSRECVYSKEKYTACPSIRFLDGFYYMIYLEARPGPTYEPYFGRSKDLAHWELSPLNPVMQFSPEDKLIGNPKLTDAQRKHIAGAVNINNCDVDLCEFRGKTVIYYCWGNQQGTEFLAQAEYDGTLPDFLRGFFPE